jgi:hypothetical protein
MKDKSILIKVTRDQHSIIKKKSKDMGFDNMSDFIRYLALNIKNIQRIIE